MSIRTRSHLVLLLALAALPACWRGGVQMVPSGQRLTNEVRRILAEDEPSAAFYRDRNRLEGMGTEIDPVLVALVNDPEAAETVRANALLLLADRRAPAAVPVMRRILLTTEEDELRAAAVVGLQKFAAESPAAANAIRSAVDDPSSRVRLSVLQALDVEDVELIRALLRREENPQVRAVAKELVSLAESRGAALPPSPDGTYRTTVPEGEPQIVFQPSWTDSAAAIRVGALWVEIPEQRLVPLAQRVETVAGVVPAFFSQDRSSVVYEAEREIRVRNLRTGASRVLGPGVAPRLIPFTDRFVFLEEQRPRRREVQGGTELTYEVLAVSFAGGVPERLGVLRVTARPDRHANASPVRWMVVGESAEGFVLRGEGMSTFLLPNPFRGPRALRPPPRRRPD
ncbi:MAG TPA: HEAT repeat domain-containing protein [Longimicrobiaceae bacterium]|nr:HEAT repeat domain-containing protein [Longimicrobiaceae bacterium]